MIRRFYQSYNALKYSSPMTILAFAIFIEAFIYTNRRVNTIRIVMIFTAILLAVIMFMYYRNKIRINKTLKKVKNPDEYEKGGCVDRSWFLEDRMLICDRKTISEHSVQNIEQAELLERNHGKYYLQVNQGSEKYEISLTDKESGQRTAAFLLRKNPDMKCINVVPKGNGTLKELGADE